MDAELPLSMKHRFDFNLEDNWGGIYLNGGEAYQVNKKTGLVRRWSRYD